MVDREENWSGGQDTLIQTGDLVDRGPDTIAVFRLFEKLRAQARSVGGEVINLMGNHEVMNIGGDLRYVTEEDYASFGGRQKRKEAWDVRSGWLGKFVLNNFNISHIHHGHTVFSHADMHPEWAKVGVDDMNFLATQAIMNGEHRAPIFTTKGPVWNRALASQEGGLEETCKTVESVKKILGVNRLISGHTPQHKTGKVLSLCGGSYLDIDVGISKYYGGHVGALEIIENNDGTQSVYALYPTGRLLV
ncbi:hypothetical protein EMPS_04787 [Entomortierella parvispora]|uniref:Calcineurin-like phosphoesterase domain-containing protein n=1 Tax=Entomortierella parvispora TaxID=205924 RepID=A0A9P3LW50_9FUNG|nr:hypothetical protein EMPS_04787 [Entomortierella parvispora]